MPVEFVLKKAVNVSEMAQAVGLSRSRFYQLVDAGTFPPPDKEPTTGRPFYSEEKQRVCLDVRQRNCGVDGKPILFNKQRSGKRRRPKAKDDEVVAILAGLKGLGLATATPAMVAEVKEKLFPNGTTGVEIGDVVKAVFLKLQRR